MIYKARMFELGIHFCPSLMFAGLARVILDFSLVIDPILRRRISYKLQYILTTLRQVLN